jgi:hypothetical protein
MRLGIVALFSLSAVVVAQGCAPSSQELEGRQYKLVEGEPATIPTPSPVPSPSPTPVASPRAGVPGSGFNEAAEAPQPAPKLLVFFNGQVCASDVTKPDGSSMKCEEYNPEIHVVSGDKKQLFYKSHLYMFLGGG